MALSAGGGAVIVSQVRMVTELTGFHLEARSKNTIRKIHDDKLLLYTNISIYMYAHSHFLMSCIQTRYFPDKIICPFQD